MQIVYIPTGLRIILIIASLLLVAFVVISARKSQMEVHYAILWISLALLILIVGIFPDLAYQISRLMGIQSVTNFVILLMILALFLLSYYSYIKISKLSSELKKLNYELAVIKEKENVTVSQKEKENVH